MNRQSTESNLITTFLLILAVTIPISAVMAQEAMTAEAMRAVIVGNTLSGKNEDGYEVHVYHDTDGTMEGKARKKYYDSGTWEIADDNLFCRKWDKWRKAKRDCFQMFQLGNNIYRLKANNQNYESLLTAREGDPEKLKQN